MTWLLEGVAIEGFRGINNAGAPLELKFHTDKVNSVFAANGVGKSSVFDAVTYAISGKIPKLDTLPAAEQAGSYYLNRFHPGGAATIVLSLKPLAGGATTEVTVVRDSAGTRTVATNNGGDGEAILKDLDREFVLLDARTFQNFIDDTPLNRGRSFASLLGLGSYSRLRQALQTVSNTRAFNNHFEVNAKNGRRILATSQISQARANINEAFTALTGEGPNAADSDDALRIKAHSALLNIPLIHPKCAGKAFHEISPDECLDSIRDAEGGPDREKLGSLIELETRWSDALATLPAPDQIEQLVELAKERDISLKQTQGDEFLRLYHLTIDITAREGWIDKHVCPACDRSGEKSVLAHAQAKAALYDRVNAVSEKLAEQWAAHDWGRVAQLEAATKEDGEPSLVDSAAKKVAVGGFTESVAAELKGRLQVLRDRASTKLSALTTEKVELEKRLPPSLVAVTAKVEAARRLQTEFRRLDSALTDHSVCSAEIARIQRLRTFICDACEAFSQAESEAATRRLAAVAPICRDIFQRIIFEPVVPAITKRAGTEELSISLATFHHLSDVSAQSLLSESYRNAFAISVYLAAASLYGGAAKFLLLDDVTSSLDAGHQFHLMEVIRTNFSRPLVTNGPQVIILSHDTLLEKYFNTNGSTIGWSHQRIEGSPRTAILPQSNAVNRVYDATMALLNAGNTQDSGPRIRQYLEYVLEEIIIRCRIPVPMDIALNDDRHMAGHLISAIDAQVKLHANAGNLVLEPAQVQGLNLAIATISANFLAHWSTGQTQAFSAGALLGVMQAIANYADCFKFEPTPGADKKFYRSLSQRQ